MTKVPEEFWRLGSADVALSKAQRALYQTSECGRTKTIISVNADEAQTIIWALADYIGKHREEYFDD